MPSGSNTDGLVARLQEVSDRCACLLDSSTAVRWEVFAKTSVTRQTEVLQGRLKRSVQIAESGVGVRSWDGSRAGFAAASALEPSSARDAVDAARAGARPGADPMPPARVMGTVPVKPGPAMPPRGWAQHIAGELGLALAGLSGSVLRLERAVVQEGRYRWTLSTGDGWSADHERMVASLLLEILVGDRPGIWREWVHISDPGSFDAEAIASRLGNRILLTRNRVTTDSGLHDLILHPEVTAQLLAAVSPLFLATDDARDPLPHLLDSNGFLAAFPLTLVDERSDPTAPVVSPCDGEGLPAKRTLLLDEGAPRHRVASWADARRFDEIPRGGAVRLSYRDRPSTGLTNLRVVTRDGMPPGELLTASRRALYVLRPLAPVVCDFERDTYSLIASGVWLRRQQVRGWHPVVELSGSLGTLLRRIAAVGEDLCWFQTAHGFVGAPSLLIRRQPVVG
ncbi:MAG: metallopeptidase TldD-related protein [Thermoanaerobaculales bacterium]|jgi:PmbA protein|nr:metallopeptidase TldD-related protein [Thermoanaerobaculales bacterium]